MGYTFLSVEVLINARIGLFGLSTYRFVFCLSDCRLNNYCCLIREERSCSQKKDIVRFVHPRERKPVGRHAKQPYGYFFLSKSSL